MKDFKKTAQQWSKFVVIKMPQKNSALNSMYLMYLGVPNSAKESSKGEK